MTKTLLSLKIGLLSPKNLVIKGIFNYYQGKYSFETLFKLKKPFNLTLLYRF